MDMERKIEELEYKITKKLEDMEDRIEIIEYKIGLIEKNQKKTSQN